MVDFARGRACFCDLQRILPGEGSTDFYPCSVFGQMRLLRASDAFFMRLRRAIIIFKPLFLFLQISLLLLMPESRDLVGLIPNPHTTHKCAFRIKFFTSFTRFSKKCASGYIWMSPLKAKLRRARGLWMKNQQSERDLHQLFLTNFILFIQKKTARIELKNIWDDMVDFSYDEEWCKIKRPWLMLLPIRITYQSTKEPIPYFLSISRKHSTWRTERFT